MEYDPETGGLALVRRPEGLISYDYDRHGSLSEMSYLGRTVSYRYDFHGRLAEVDAGSGGHWIYAYNAGGLKSRVENAAEGLVEEYKYDAIGRLEKLTHRRVADGTLVESFNGQLRKECLDAHWSYHSKTRRRR